MPGIYFVISLIALGGPLYGVYYAWLKPGMHPVLRGVSVTGALVLLLLVMMVLKEGARHV